ncbi:glycosyltransferase [Pseudomonas oryzihabitans]|uniref:glycosyltransferase n=1 Tax=Pseudomonas oryzihabitans TaxID=47885 RepID=UPI0030BA8F4B
MRIALLAPLPMERNGIADYAVHFRQALEEEGMEVLIPLRHPEHGGRPARRLTDFDWLSVDVVHAELGGGRVREYETLLRLRQRYPRLPITVTVHDPERLVWRRRQQPWPLSLLMQQRSPWPQVATVLGDPMTLREERTLAASLTQLVTLTETGANALRQRLRLAPGKVVSIPHGNRVVPVAPLPPLEPLRLLYFGFIYRGKGIEDLLDALAKLLSERPEWRGRIRLTLAGGTAPEITFAAQSDYLGELRERALRRGLSGCLDWQLDLPEEAIVTTIQAHHLLVLPYRESRKLAILGAQRGTSGVLAWAMACGRGVITSDARAFAEETAHGNGVTYPEGDVSALTERLRALIDHPQQLESWAQHAAQLGAARAWPQTAQRFRQVFEQASRGHTDAPR